jgi:hypothetical protein
MGVDVSPLSQNLHMKRCADCKELKPYSEFPPSKKAKDGCHSYCKVCNNRRSQESRKRLHGGSRHYHLKHRYGIGADDFDRMVLEQGRRCAICGRADPEHVDHDHETGAVRGILCFNCNGGLGQFKDDLDALLAATTYLATTSSEHRDLRDLAQERAGELRETAV